MVVSPSCPKWLLSGPPDRRLLRAHSYWHHWRELRLHKTSGGCPRPPPAPPLVTPAKIPEEDRWRWPEAEVQQRPGASSSRRSDSGDRDECLPSEGRKKPGSCRKSHDALTPELPTTRGPPTLCPGASRNSPTSNAYRTRCVPPDCPAHHPLWGPHPHQSALPREAETRLALKQGPAPD